MLKPLHPLDAIALVLYAVFLLSIGFRQWRRKTSAAEDYLLGGRRLTMPAFVMTLVSTWYGGILGVGEYTYRYGVANWFVFGLPYYIAALIFALFLAGRARRTEYRNMPDQLYFAYGPLVGRVGAGIVFLMSLPAAYVLMVGIILSTVLGISVSVGVVVGTVISVTYVYLGGFRSVIRTDKFQFAIMYGGFVLLFVYLWSHAGSPASMWARLPESHTNVLGGQPFGAIFVWYFIALATLIEPAFYQRCYAAKNEGIAKRGILLSVCFWLVFDFLTTTSGLYAVVLYPDIAEPLKTFPILANDFLPPGIRGLFWVTMLSIVMGTVDSYTFLSAVTGGRDLILGKGRGNDHAEIAWTRAAVPIVALLAIGIAMYFRSVVEIWYIFGTVGTPALLLPIVTTFFPRARFRPESALVNMMFAGGLALVWEILRQTRGADAGLLIIPAIYLGLGASVLIWSADMIAQSRLRLQQARANV
jgi:SSS family solute:Na+ symporter